MLILDVTSCSSVISYGSSQVAITGNGTIVDETRLQGASFTGIVSLGIANVTLVQNSSNPASVVVSTDSNLQQYLTATISGSILYLGVQSGISISPSKSIEITVSAPLISSIESLGTGNITGQGLSASPTLSIQNMGTGNIVLSGSATTMTLTSIGTGQVDAGSFFVTNITLTLSGTGNCTVNATGTISGSMSGTGNLSYNNGATCQVARSGTGQIISH